MIGLDKFSAHFEPYNDQYIVIGGAACDDHFSEAGLDFRATDDIDLVLVVGILKDTFIAHFWEFIKEGKYARKEVAEERTYYRFTDPETKGFPAKLELLSLIPDPIKERGGMRFTPIPADEDLSSLSAILMDDNYYEFTLGRSVKAGALHRADDIALICLKVKAFLNLSEDKAKGRHVNSHDIKKHKHDVFRLAATLPGDQKVELPADILKDLKLFVDKMKEDPPNAQQFLKLMGITGDINTDTLMKQLKKTFELE